MTIHIWRPRKLSNFQDPPLALATLKIIRPPWPWTSNFKRPPPHPPSPNDNQSIKENIIQAWLLYIMRSFLQVGFCFQYQLIHLVWFSIDLFPFSWSQPRPQSCFKKWKTNFLPSSYNEKMCWSQNWTETSLSAFSWLNILVCAVV